MPRLRWVPSHRIKLPCSQPGFVLLSPRLSRSVKPSFCWGCGLRQDERCPMPRPRTSSIPLHLSSALTRAVPLHAIPMLIFSSPVLQAVAGDTGSSCPEVGSGGHGASPHSRFQALQGQQQTGQWLLNAVWQETGKEAG